MTQGEHVKVLVKGQPMLMKGRCGRPSPKVRAAAPEVQAPAPGGRCGRHR
jgi:hypothetical protein